MTETRSGLLRGLWRGIEAMAIAYLTHVSSLYELCFDGDDWTARDIY